MRFNAQGKFNVPFGHNPDRFRRAYITKIVNQVLRVRQIIKDKDWMFKICDWRETLSEASQDDFVYLDPPYIGRHTDYYNNWTEEDAVELARLASSLKCGFALSMWKANKYRENAHLDLHWNGFVEKTFAHFYHVGSKEEFRNEITEALIIKTENVANQMIDDIPHFDSAEISQLSIFRQLPE
jgi:DNA adenine methylase